MTSGRVDSYRLPSQTIIEGGLRQCFEKLVLKEPVLAVGTERSVALLQDIPALTQGPVAPSAAPHNPTEAIESAVKVTNTIQPKTIVAIGGGSAIDLGKALVQANNGELIAVPTTLSGAEMTRVYGTREADGRKRGGGGSKLMPGTVIYDSTLLESLPNDVLVGTGINALAHAIEAHYGQSRHWFGRAAAQRSGAELIPEISNAISDNGTVGRIDNLFQWSSLAGFALNACGMGLHHAICHVIGGMTGISHHLINVAVLPSAVKMNESRAPERIAQSLKAMNIEDLAGSVHSLAQKAGLPENLRDLGIREDSLPQISRYVLEEPSLRNNPVPLTMPLIKMTLDFAYSANISQ